MGVKPLWALYSNHVGPPGPFCADRHVASCGSRGPKAIEHPPTSFQTHMQLVRARLC